MNTTNKTEMHTKDIIHNLVILDESGSMQSIKNKVIESFNEIIDTMKLAGDNNPGQEHYFSMISFNGGGIKDLHWMQPVIGIHRINDKNYLPAYSTPLYDAMAHGLNRLRQALQSAAQTSVLVTIFTDGEENASQEYNHIQIKELVKELSALGWTFTYIGTDHDVRRASFNPNIQNNLIFEKSDDGLNEMLAKEKLARMNFYKREFNSRKGNTSFYAEDGEDA